jgi:hypothetical protein
VNILLWSFLSNFKEQCEVYGSDDEDDFAIDGDFMGAFMRDLTGHLGERGW